MSQPDTNPDAVVAIVGIACRFPGADGPDELWQNLRGGVESIRRLGEHELEAAGVPREVYTASDYVPAAGLISGHDQFDAGLFGYSAMEAAIIDPQQRLFLEKCWEALEDAGQDPDRFAGRIGVFAGAGAPSYLVRNLYPSRSLRARFGSMVLLTGNLGDSMCTRVSYKLNLRGPSITVQTSCSTSLVACHLAVQSVLSGECDLALAGGVRIRASRAGYVHTEGGIASADGHCRAFDAAADGTIGGEGVGVVVLQRLSDALEQGANIYATILGSAINNDGSNKVSFTAPSAVAQAEVISEALQIAGVDVESIAYVEAFGSGTPLGDPIEVRALTRAFREHTDRVGFCALGSVKTNFGHTDAAAGVASLIKCALSVQHGEIPPSLHFERPNPELQLEASPFRVADRLTAWPDTGSSRRAGVTAFGIGGTNVHMVLEQAPSIVASRGDDRQLLVLSAHSRRALDELSLRIAAHLESARDSDLADVAFTLQVGRRHLRQRRIVVCRDRDHAARALRSGQSTATGKAGSPRPVVFVFPGDGAQHVDMGRELYARQPVFRDAIDACAARLRERHDVDMLPALYPADPSRTETAAQSMHRSTIGLPSLFAVEYALASLWLSWGIQPSGVIGYGLGEYAAAVVAGALSWEDALDMVVTRVPPGIASTPPRIPIIPSPSDDRPADDDRILLEVGPGRTTETEPAELVLLTTLGALWLAGQSVDWASLHRGVPRRRISLPRYAFQRRRYWIEPPPEWADADPELALGSLDDDRATPYIAPEGPDETAMVGIWREILGTAEIGVADDFFELGGHSLLATQLLARVRAVFGASLPRDTMFQARTVRELVRVVDSARGRGGEQPPAIDVRASGAMQAAATPGQIWFYTLCGSDPDNQSLWVNRTLLLEGALDPPRLVAAFGRFLDDNRVFTSGYREVDGKLYQVVAPPPPGPLLDVLDRSGLPEDRWQEVHVEMLARMSGRVDMSAGGPFLRCCVARLRPDRHLLALRIHHIAADALSIGLIVSEIGAAYDRLGLESASPPPGDREQTVSYIDYADHLARWVDTAPGRQARDYWESQLRGAPGLELPIDRPRDELDRLRDRAPHGIVALTARTHPAALSADLHERIKSVAIQEQITYPAIYLGALAVLLHATTGQDDLCIETVSNARLEDARLLSMHGIMTNTLVIRLSLADRPDPRELFRRTHRAVFAAEAHSMVNVLEIAGHHLRRANFNYVAPGQRGAAPFGSGSGLHAVATPWRLPMPEWRRPWDVQLFLREGSQGVDVFLSLNELFSAETGQRLLGQYIDILAGLT